MVACSACTIDRRSSWNGTPGMSTELRIVHAPNPDAEKRIARAAVDFIIDQFGSEEAAGMTLDQMIECFCDL